MLTDEIARLWLETRRALASENNPLHSAPSPALSLEFNYRTRNGPPEGPNAPVMVVEAKHIISPPANRRRVGGPFVCKRGQ